MGLAVFFLLIICLAGIISCILLFGTGFILLFQSVKEMRRIKLSPGRVISAASGVLMILAALVILKISSGGIIWITDSLIHGTPLG